MFSSVVAVLAVAAQTVTEGSSAGVATHLAARRKAVVSVVAAVEWWITSSAGRETLPRSMVRVEDRMTLS